MDFTGARVLDIFAGSGSLGIEAISRGAGHVTFIDSSRDAAAVIRANLSKMELEDRGRIMLADVTRALEELGSRHEQYNLIFVDAPYKNDVSNIVVETIGRLGLAAPGGWIVVEQSKRAPEAPPAPSGFERPTVARISDHRLAFYLRPEER